MTNYNPFSLEGKTILITGASSGIGRATAIECSKLGADTILVARSKERLDETLKSLQGGENAVYSVDLQNSNDVDALIETLPQVDGLVNNAGISNTLPVVFYKEDVLKNVFQTNTFAPILFTTKLLKKKKLRKGASIVFTSSICGSRVGAVANGIYSASKAAIEGYMKCAAVELAAKEIRVNAVCPGMTRTPLINLSAISEEQMKADIERYPLRRYGEPKEIALSIVYLLSDASSWVTGTSLVTDGGYTAL